MTKQYHIASF